MIGGGNAWTEFYKMSRMVINQMDNRQKAYNIWHMVGVCQEKYVCRWKYVCMYEWIILHYIMDIYFTWLGHFLNTYEMWLL